jgi:hypothetical protein
LQESEVVGEGLYGGILEFDILVGAGWTLRRWGLGSEERKLGVRGIVSRLVRVARFRSGLLLFRGRD